MPHTATNEDIDDQCKQHPEKTCIFRATLSQEIAEFLPPAPFKRRVQCIIPPGSVVYIDEDRPTHINGDGTAPPGMAGRNRDYKLPPFEAGQTVEFDLYPGQWLVGSAREGLVHLAVIVEPRHEHR